MKKNVWILHHYATPPDKTGLVRPYDFSKQLKKRGYNPVVFASAFLHWSGYSLISGEEKFTLDNSSGVPFVYIKTTAYTGNGASRIKNMLSFYRNLKSTAREYARKYSKPDIIIASSPHPLTMIAGNKLAKKFGCECICEIRDLWPETMVAYGMLKPKSMVAKALYAGEKWIYKKADKLIFTMEGGADYICDRGWDKQIDLAKVHYINNGVDLEAFDYNREHFQIDDPDLLDPDIFKVVYAGSIRLVNNLGLLLDAAKLLSEQGNTKIKFLIWGDGNEREELEKRVADEGLTNIVFKGRVEKKYIPYILSCADLTTFVAKSDEKSDINVIARYGGSLNKLFEYLASGKPVLCVKFINYSIVEANTCGMELGEQTPENYIYVLEKMMHVSIEERTCMEQNAKAVVKQFDFKALTDKLINVIEK